MTLIIKQQTERDWPDIWPILESVFRAGESYPLPLDVSEHDAKTYWIKTDGYNAVARDEAGAIIGVYYFRPDQGGPGSHICNAGYIVADAARGMGVAVKLCLHSQKQARAMGFKGMKFNLVVAANARRLRLGEKLAWK